MTVDRGLGGQEEQGESRKGRERAGEAGLHQELRGAGRGCEGEQGQGGGRRGKGCPRSLRGEGQKD